MDIKKDNIPPTMYECKKCGEVKIIIFNDVEKLNRMYERLYRMAFIRG